MKYVLDSNVFIQAARTYYSFDITDSFWNSLIEFAQKEEICSIDKVYDELIIGIDDLATWVKDEFRPYFMNTQNNEVIAQYGNIINWAQNQKQYQPYAKNEFMENDYADSWIIAYAKQENLTIVTQEIYSREIRKKIPIPNVCEAFEIEYCDTFTLLRELGIKL